MKDVTLTPLEAAAAGGLTFASGFVFAVALLILYASRAGTKGEPEKEEEEKNGSD